MNPRALTAEFLGTFALVFFGPGAAVVQAQTGVLGHAGVAIVFGLAVASIITIIAPISGAHINPVATLSMWLSGRFEARDVLGYILAQLLGASLAAFARNRARIGCNDGEKFAEHYDGGASHFAK